MESHENYLKVLRKALGQTQHQFAELLGCAYSTLQGYEGGRTIPKEIQAKALTLALENKLGGLAAQIANLDDASASSPATPAADRDRIHLTVDAILDFGDEATKEAFHSILRLCELHIMGRPSSRGVGRR
jgi:transcriptional regulator with XRE-family HTH domain